MSAQSQPTEISQELHQLNLDRLADIARRELLEAIQYERNYSPLTWFKTVTIEPRETEPTIRNLLNGKRRRLELTNKNKAWVKRRRALVAEIAELEKKLVQGKQ